MIRGLRALLRNNHDNAWNYIICEELCWKWRKHYRKVQGSLRRPGGAAPGRVLRRPRMQIKCNQNNHSGASRNTAWRPPAALSHSGCTTRPLPERKNTCPTDGNANGLHPSRFLLFRIVSTGRNHTRDSGLMREITISGLKYFSSDYMVSLVTSQSKRDRVCSEH